MVVGRWMGHELARLWGLAGRLDRPSLLRRDPFDRLLVAQAMSELAQLYTADRELAAYSELVICVWGGRQVQSQDKEWRLGCSATRSFELAGRSIEQEAIFWSERPWRAHGSLKSSRAGADLRPTMPNPVTPEATPIGRTALRRSSTRYRPGVSERRISKTAPDPCPA